jgi:hypothetical protein
MLEEQSLNFISVWVIVSPKRAATSSVRIDLDLRSRSTLILGAIRDSFTRVISDWRTGFSTALMSRRALPSARTSPGLQCHRGRGELLCRARHGRFLPIVDVVRASLPQRVPARSTGPPRFVGVPGRTPTPGAPTPGVTARATGRGRSATPGLTMQPAGYSTYWQYTTAPASSVLAVRNPVISSAASAIDNFIFASYYAPK